MFLFFRSKIRANVKAKAEYQLVLDAAKISKKLKEQQNLPLPLPATGLLSTPSAQPLLMLTASGKSDLHSQESTNDLPYLYIILIALFLF